MIPTPANIVVIIPSWDLDRALDLVMELRELATTGRVEYVLMYPEAIEDFEHGLFAEPGVRTVASPHHLAPVEAMAAGAQLVLATPAPADQLLMFIHDDVTIHQQAWDRSLLTHFAAHPRCGLAGFGGGIGLGHPDLYKIPYDHTQLARYDFISNMLEAEHHGRRVEHPVRVAALDGFSLITTREMYERCGYVELNAEGTHVRGLWDACLRDGIPFHMYDAWVSCRAAERGYETWMLPVACHHEGGQTSVKHAAEYAAVVERLGYASPEELYHKGHEHVYERFRKLLPLRVPTTSKEQ